MSNGDDAGLERSREVGTLVAGGAPVVTITGPAGVGKSTLVRRWLATLDTATAPEVVHVFARRLPPLRGELEDAILASLSAARGSALGESLGHQLRLAANTVIVIDGADQVVPALRELVADLAAKTMRAQLVITSREILGLPAERVIRLEPLTVPTPSMRPAEIVATEAASLFLQLSGRSPTALSDPELQDLAAICSKLDGLPLAIELAATRSQVLSLRELSQELEDRFATFDERVQLLEGTRATLFELFDWSWQSLTEAERTGLIIASQFVGSFERDAFVSLWHEVAAAPEAQGLPVLASLCRKSLVSVTSDHDALRYDILAHTADLVRAHQGDAQLWNAAAAAHMAYFIGCAEQVWEECFYSTYPTMGERHLRNLGNYVAALDRLRGAPGAAGAELSLARTTASVVGIRQAFTSADRNLKAVDGALQALAAAPSRRSAMSLEASVILRVLRARALASTGDAQAAADELQAVVTTNPASNESSPTLPLARALIDLARVHLRTGAVTPAAEALEAASALRKGAPSLYLDEASAACQVAVHRMRGENDLALGHIERALATAQAMGNAGLQGRHLLNLGVWWYAQGNFEAAQRHLADAEALLRRAHDTRTLAFWHANKGNLDYELGNHRVAEDHLRDALVLCDELDEAWLGILTTANLASLLAETDRPKEAVSQLELAIAGAKALGDKRLEGRYLAMLAAVNFVLGQPGTGQMFLEKTRQAIPADTDPGILAAIALHEGHDRLHRLRTLDPRRGATQRDELSAKVTDDIRTAIASQQASSDDLRFAARYFLRDATSDTLIVDARRSWFMHGPSQTVTLETRHTAQRLFELLVEQHLETPGTALGHAELIAKGWPGEAIDDEAARNRLKVAMSQLRKLGLGAALKGAPGAYGLAADLRVISVEFADLQR